MILVERAFRPRRCIVVKSTCSVRSGCDSYSWWIRFFFTKRRQCTSDRVISAYECFKKNEDTACSCIWEMGELGGGSDPTRNYQYDTLLGHTSVTVVSVKFSGNQRTLQNAVVMKWRKMKFWPKSNAPAQKQS